MPVLWVDTSVHRRDAETGRKTKSKPESAEGAEVAGEHLAFFFVAGMLALRAADWRAVKRRRSALARFAGGDFTVELRRSAARYA
jgi:hypothetical protein